MRKTETKLEGKKSRSLLIRSIKKPMKKANKQLCNRVALMRKRPLKSMAKEFPMIITPGKIPSGVGYSS
jgi:hypothetical protein